MLRNSKAFNDIKSLCGMQEFKAFSEKLTKCKDNMEKTGLRELPLPNLVFAAAPGSGVTLHIRLLTSLICELDLMRMIGDEQCFEWKMDASENSFDRLLQRVRRAGGFYGQFRGVIGIDIVNLLKENNIAPSMERLMEYVDARQGMILFVFVIPIDTSEKLKKKLLASFSSRTPVELITMPFPDDQEVLDYISLELTRRGFTVSRDANAVIRREIDKLKRLCGFEGYQTLQNLTDEIVWRKVSSENGDSVQIDEKDVAFIATSMCNTTQNVVNHSDRHVIGFGDERRQP